MLVSKRSRTLTDMLSPTSFPISSFPEVNVSDDGCMPCNRIISFNDIRCPWLDIQWPLYRLREIQGDTPCLQVIVDGAASKSIMIVAWDGSNPRSRLCFSAVVRLVTAVALSSLESEIAPVSRKELIGGHTASWGHSKECSGSLVRRKPTQYQRLRC